MKKSHKILLVLLGIIVLTVVGFNVMQPKEPEYQGRKLTEWIADLGEGAPKDRQALEVIKQIPEQVLPFVEARIRNNQDPAARSAHQRVLIGIQEKIFGRRSSKSYHWAVDFWALRGLGTNALPALERLLLHRDSCGDSADTLAELDAIEVLEKGLATNQPSFVRWNSIRSLGMVPVRKNEATDLLFPLLLQNTNGGIVVITMQSLEQIK